MGECIIHRASNNTNHQDPGIALWLVPRKNTPLYDTLTSLMTSLQSLFPEAPSFEPHITITTNLDITYKSEVTRLLDSSIVALNSLPSKDYLVRFNGLKSTKKYFKKLYFTIDRDLTLVSFARIIRELFVILPNLIKENDAKDSATKLTIEQLQTTAADQASKWSIEEFEPHLSLMYSDIYPIDQASMRTVNIRIQDSLNIDRIEAISDHNIGWSGGALKVVSCEGPVNEWEVLGSIDLH